MWLTKLRKVGINDLGNLDNSDAYIGKFSLDIPLIKLLNDNIQNWWWTTISDSDVVPTTELVILFINHIYIHSENPTVSISGVQINDMIFIKEKTKRQNFDLKFAINTDKHVLIKRANTSISLNNTILRGYFDLRNCLYYHKIGN